MIYLISQMIVALLLAAVAGGAIGWLIHRSTHARQADNLRHALARQHNNTAHIQSEISMLTDDYDELRRRSQEEIETLRQENAQIPFLNTNLEQSQLLVRQMMQKHEAKVRDLITDNQSKAEQLKNVVDREQAYNKLQAELDNLRRQVASQEKAGKADKPHAPKTIKKAQNRTDTPPADVNPNGYQKPEMFANAIISDTRSTASWASAQLDPLVDPLDATVQAVPQDRNDSGISSVVVDIPISASNVEIPDDSDTDPFDDVMEFGDDLQRELDGEPIDISSDTDSNNQFASDDYSEDLNEDLIENSGLDEDDNLSTGSKLDDEVDELDENNSLIENSELDEIDELDENDSLIENSKFDKIVRLNGNDSLIEDSKFDKIVELNENDNLIEDNKFDKIVGLNKNNNLIEDSELNKVVELDENDAPTQDSEFDEVVELDENDDLSVNNKLDDVSGLNEHDDLTKDNELLDVENLNDIEDLIEDSELNDVENLDEIEDLLEDSELDDIEDLDEGDDLIEDSELDDADGLNENDDLVEVADLLEVKELNGVTELDEYKYHNEDEDLDETSVYLYDPTIQYDDGSASEHLLDGSSDRSSLFDPVDQRDDLQQIFGIGPVTEKALNDLGITSYSQLAELKSHDIETIANALQIVPGRIQRDDWVGNARRQLEDVLQQL